MRRYAQRVDANTTQIVGAFRDAGFSVEIVNDLFDLLVGYGGLSMPIEIKNGNKPLKPGRQTRFHTEFTGGIRIVTCVEDVIGVVAEMRHMVRLLRGSP